MRIANPIYDAVFKFFMEDPEVAKRLISNIIGQTVLSLDAQPQEVLTQSTIYPIAVLRLDYKAVIVNEQGETKKVLIEMQKAEKQVDIQRFRRYLGENYAKVDIIDEKEEMLPIICIYFLGFRVKYLRTLYPVLKVAPQVIDVETSLPIAEQNEAMQDDFIKHLTHTSYFIQIQNLPETTQNVLLHRLSAFNQVYKVADIRWQLEFEDWHNIADPDLQLFVQRLWFAVQNNKVQAEIRAEQELDKHFIDYARQVEVLTQSNTAQVQALAEKDQALAQAEQQKIATAKNFIALGMSVSVVAQAMQVSETEVKAWLNQ